MSRITRTSFLTPAAGVLAMLTALAWVRLGPLVLVVIALPIYGVILMTRRSDVTAMLLPLCLLPYAISISGVFVSASDLLVVSLTCLFLVAIASSMEPVPASNPLFIPAIAFAAWTMASAIWAATPIKAVVDATQRLEFAVCGVALIAALPNDGRHARRAIRTLAVGAACLGVATVAIGIARHRYFAVYPLGIHKNSAGSLLSYGLIAMVGLRLMITTSYARRWINAGSLVVLAGLILTGSRGAWVGTLVACASVVAIRHPRILWPVVSITILGVALILILFPPDILRQEAGFDTQFTTASVRADTWQDGVEAIAAHPLLGVGSGSFIADIHGQGFQSDPNNLLLQTWAETGLPGLALLLWFFTRCLLLAFRNTHELPNSGIPSAVNLVGIAIVITAVVHAQFDMFWSRGTGLAAFLGAGLVVWASRAREGRPRPNASALSKDLWSRCQ